MKPNRVSTIALCPLPTANRVPDAHEPPTCIPIPNRNAPTTSAMPIGLVKPFGAPLRPTPVDSTTENSTQATASISMCARSATPCPTATTCRHAEVKPNREWNRVKPSASPSTEQPTMMPLAYRDTAQASSTANTRPIVTTVQLVGGAGLAAGWCAERSTAGSRRNVRPNPLSAGSLSTDTRTPLVGVHCFAPAGPTGGLIGTIVPVGYQSPGLPPMSMSSIPIGTSTGAAP